MKNRGVLAAAALAVLLVASAGLAQAELIKEVAIGARWKTFELTGDKNFVGTITADTVDEHTEWHPTNLNMLFVLCPYGGVSLEYDRFGATMEKDGKLFWNTFTLGLNLRHHFKQWNLAPYGVVGLTYNSPNFEENNWWRQGWSGQAEYDARLAAKPDNVDPVDWMSSGRMRDMKTDPALGFTLGLGLDFFVWKNMAINADVRWNLASTDVTYTIVNDNGDTLLRRDFSYDLDTVSYSLGLRWYF
jgi:opacity protein-like surface antigen